MKCLNWFVVQVPQAYKDTITTDGGVTLFADRRFSAKQTANTDVRVHSVPMNYEGPIKGGDDVFIDHTVLLRQIYSKSTIRIGYGEQDSPFLINRDKGYYKVDPKLIIAYRPRKGSNWIGSEDNVLLEIDVVEKRGTSNIVVPENFRKEESSPRAVVHVDNKNLNDMSVKKGDRVYFDPTQMVDVYLGEKKYSWLRNKDLLAKVENGAN